MIRFVSTRSHAYTIDEIRKHPDAVGLTHIDYDQLIASRSLQPATTVFTDFDRLSAWDLELAARIQRQLVAHGVPTLNDPARVKTRHALLRALHEAGVNDFNAYRLDEAVRPERYPVFLRRERGHGKPLGGLLADADALDRAIEDALTRGVPESSLLIVEYAAEPAAPGLFRKLSTYRIGDRSFAGTCVHDDQWLVKYGKMGGATPALYADELRIVRENPYGDPVQRAFELAGIEYGRADFGLVRGRVQVYEINTNPHVRLGGPHPSPLRMESQRLVLTRLFEALRTLDTGHGGAPIRLEDRALARQRGWFGRRRMTRYVP
jgi:hypothetical protein